MQPIINCLWNFLGLNVVRRVPDYVYGAIQNSPEKNAINDPKYLKIFTVQTTTSASAKSQIPEHKLEFDEICPEEVRKTYPEYIYILFWDREKNN